MKTVDWLVMEEAGAALETQWWIWSHHRDTSVPKRSHDHMFLRFHKNKQNYHIVTKKKSQNSISLLTGLWATEMVEHVAMKP